MKETVILKDKIWVVFNDKDLLSKPICKVLTVNNKEEYAMGIHLLKIQKYAIEEKELIEKIVTLPIFNLSQFIKEYASN